ncbi:MFS transporter [Liquorilactobacillus nagelii]|uniref:MFS transporter n=1 Tax=Liquorilactobacillus nagelii TaxID=82688 RepID=UPI0006F1B29E|nr:MFS transporter [Liquorilactobacillus nagelii]KRL40564.1 transport protein [Liquorilactobacillus nagelii DSM 13675]QYH54494.1 MFS transporter [Liquorilactobacillus nagelii DSM 13675]
MEIQSSQQTKLKISLYLNYFVHGIGLIILAQNMQALGNLWQTPLATVSYVISGVGIGRLLAYLILGSLADRYGRKNFVYVGMLCYLVFFGGILIAPNIQVAYGLAILAGVANSALDAGTYPTFIELGGSNGASNILIKAFMSLGEFILPLLVALLENHQWWFGWSFILAIAVLLVNFVILRPLKFPPQNKIITKKQQHFTRLIGWRRWLIAGCLTGYGYTSMALMILYTQWISLFAAKILHFSNWQAHFLLSLYSIGSISGVIILFALLSREVSETKLLLILNSLSLISLVLIGWSTQLVIVAAASLLFGMTAAGGVMQTGLNLFLKLFPQRKGLITGVFFTGGSLASFSIPLITGWLSKFSIATALHFDILIAVLGLLLVIVIKILLAVVQTPDLKQVRKRISKLDHWIIVLLNRRFQAVKLAGEIKTAQQHPILDTKREEQVLEQVARQSADQQITPYLLNVYQQIMQNSRDYEAQHKD